MHRCPAAPVTSLWENKGVRKNLSSQGRNFLKKLFQREGVHQRRSLVAVLFPWGKSHGTLGQWPRTGPARGQRARLLPAPARSPWTLCHHRARDVLVWGMLPSHWAEEGVSHTRTRG